MRHTLVRASDGRVFAFGENDKNQLGHGLGTMAAAEPRPRVVGALLRLPAHRLVAHIACGSDFSVALSTAGALFSWGGNAHGQLGLGREARGAPTVPAPTRVAGFGVRKPLTVACGNAHCVAAMDDGTVFTWGSAAQVGQGVFRPGHGDADAPTIVQYLQPWCVDRVACGPLFSAAVARNGEVHVWGVGRGGELGLGDRRDRFVPRRLQGGSIGRDVEIVDVQCGGHHCAALDAEGRVHVWGAGADGQLGLGTKRDGLSPQLVPLSDGSEGGPLPRAVQVACGRRHTVVLTARKDVIAFGLISAAALGGAGLWRNSSRMIEVDRIDSTIQRAYRPMKVAGLKDVAVREISGTHSASLSLTTVLCQPTPAAAAASLRAQVSAEQLQRLDRGALKEYALRLQKASVAVAEPAAISDAGERLRAMWEEAARPAPAPLASDGDLHFPPGTNVHIDRHGNIEVSQKPVQQQQQQQQAPDYFSPARQPLPAPQPEAEYVSPSRAYVSPIRSNVSLSPPPALPAGGASAAGNVHVNRHGSVQIGGAVGAPYTSPAQSARAREQQLQHESDSLRRMVQIAESETRKLTSSVRSPAATKSVSPYTLSADYATEMERIKQDALNAGLEVRRATTIRRRAPLPNRPPLAP